MPLYVVTYAHPDEAGWREHLTPHLQWIHDQLAAGTVKASGPLNATPVRSALLVMSAESRAALDAVIATDPFAVHGQIADMTVAKWDPIFGAFNADSSMPDRAPGG